MGVAKVEGGMPICHNWRLLLLLIGNLMDLNVGTKRWSISLLSQGKWEKFWFLGIKLMSYQWLLQILCHWCEGNSLGCYWELNSFQHSYLFRLSCNTVRTEIVEMSALLALFSISGDGWCSWKAYLSFSLGPSFAHFMVIIFLSSIAKLWRSFILH